MSLLKLRSRLEFLAGIQDSGVAVQYSEKTLNEKYILQSKSGRKYLITTKGADIDTIHRGDKNTGIWGSSSSEIEIELHKIESLYGIKGI